MDGFAFSLAGLVVGTAVGATGVGGGSLMTPILILFYGISPAVAVGTDLLYASISKGFGVLLHGRRGTLDWGIVGWLSAGSVPAALLTLLLLRDHVAGPQADQLIKLTLAGAIMLTATFTFLQEPLLRLIKRRGPAEGPGFVARHQRALALNAAAVILAHNHPSGVAEPSRADEFLTQTLKSALGLVDVRFLDHFIVAGEHVVSFAERGLV